MGKSGVTAVCHGAFAMEACCTPCHSGGRRSFSSRFLLAATYWVRSGRLQVAGAAWSAMLLVCTRRCQSLANVPRSEQASMQTARLGQCVGRDGLCQIFGGIWAPPLGTSLEARYICSSLIGKPRHFEWCTKPAILRAAERSLSGTRAAVRSLSGTHMHFLFWDVSQVLIPMDGILHVQMKNKYSVSIKYPMDWILRALWWRCHMMDGKMKTTSSPFTDQPRLYHRKHCSLQHDPCFRALINLQPRIRCPQYSSARVSGTPVASTADSKRNALLSALF